jgi:predicted dinucleotide-binding enzyme
MRTLLIGGTGTVGREVAQRLAELGEDVIIMSRKAEAWHPADTQTRTSGSDVSSGAIRERSARSSRSPSPLRPCASVD